MKSGFQEKKIIKWYDPIIFVTLVPLAALLVKLLLISCRLLENESGVQGKEPVERFEGKAVFATWHQRIVFHARGLAGKDLTVMVSQSRDGEYAARFAKYFGVKCVRGSSTRGGSDALKALTYRIMKEGTNGGMVVDGPVGPARVAKLGAVVMARNAQVPLIPVVWSADKCWILNSWDRLIIPKPFARIIYSYGEPIMIPVSVNGNKIEDYRKLCEDRLNEAAAWCDKQLGEERPWRRVKKAGVPEVGPVKDSRTA